jgi:hypothetical protein
LKRKRRTKRRSQPKSRDEGKIKGGISSFEGGKLSLRTDGGLFAS